MILKSLSEKNKISFATPLISLFVIILLIGIIVQNYLISEKITNEIKSTQAENITLNAQSITDLIDMQISANENQLIAYSKAFGMIITYSQDGVLNYTTVEDIIKDIKQSNKFYETVFMSDVDGKILYSSDSSILGADITAREYYSSIIMNGKSAYTSKKTIQSKATGNLTIIHAVPVFQNHKRIGILGVSLNMTKFGDSMVLSKSIGKTGHPYILDKDGVILVHQDDELLGSPAQVIDPFFQTVLNSVKSIINVSFTLDGSAKQGVFIRMPRTGWIVCLAIDDSEAFQSIKDLQILLWSISTILILVISLILLFYIKIKLVTKLTFIETIMAGASKGDLTERGIVKGRDEIAGMAKYFNILLDSLSSFFTKLKDKLQELDEVGHELSTNMEETTAAVYQIRTNVKNSLSQIEMQEESVSSTVTVVEEITQNIESLDRNIERQASTVQQGSTAVEEMIAQIKAVSSSTEEAERLMIILNDSSTKGKQNLQIVSKMVQGIESRSQELEEANKLISGLAAKTNLLAMNAAIEAAHAGNAGRGFAVVADEIRKLAEQSTKQSAQVKNTINDINSSIIDIVEGSDNSNISFEEILKNMKQMGQVTGEIKSSMEEQVSGSSQVLQALEELKEAGEEVFSGSREMTFGNKTILKSVNNLTQISSEVSMAIKEIGNGMDEISQSVLNVSNIADKNRNSINIVRNEAAHYTLTK